jgi:hypothetical protein
VPNNVSTVARIRCHGNVFTDQTACNIEGATHVDGRDL